MLLEKRDKEQFFICLEQNPSISIKDIIDSKGYTMLHIACFKNLDEIAYYIV